MRRKSGRTTSYIPLPISRFPEDYGERVSEGEGV